MIASGHSKVLQCVFAKASTDPVTKTNGPSESCKQKGCTGFHNTPPACETFMSLESLRSMSIEAKA